VKVWVSRSQPGADRQAAELRAAGHRPLVAPVLGIEPTAAVRPPGSFEIVVFLSEHAVRLGLPALLDSAGWSGVRVFAVGASTADTLAAAGVSAEVPVLPTSEGLLALTALSAVSGRGVLLVCGEGGRDTLDAGLTARGARVVRFECYRRLALDRLDPAVLACDAILAASGEGLRQVASLWLGAGGRRDVPVLVPSARVAARGVEVGLTRLHDCRGADSDAWLRGLAQLATAGGS
jgi:uroporphyrinogen-III synthase